MIPWPGETRALRQIEERLAESDPRLAAMFAVFDADPARARGCSRPAESRRARAGHLAVLVVLAIGLALCVMMAVLAAR